MSDLSRYIDHSGGALGSDRDWQEIGSAYGLKDVRHYWYGVKTPYGNTEISEADLNEGWRQVLLANKTLKRRPEKYKNLLSRNWQQVKNASAVYAIGTLTESRKTVNGGTGWAVQMAIDDYMTVFVFDQIDNAWYEYNWAAEKFTTTAAPILTLNFAGIGTREINSNGKLAIKAVYVKTWQSINR